MGLQALGGGGGRGLEEILARLARNLDDNQSMIRGLMSLIRGLMSTIGGLMSMIRRQMHLIRGLMSQSKHDWQL